MFPEIRTCKHALYKRKINPSAIVDLIRLIPELNSLYHGPVFDTQLDMFIYLYLYIEILFLVLRVI